MTKSEQDVWNAMWPLLSGENADILRSMLRAITLTAMENKMGATEICSVLRTMADELEAKARKVQGLQ